MDLFPLNFNSNSFLSFLFRLIPFMSPKQGLARVPHSLVQWCTVTASSLPETVPGLPEKQTMCYALCTV